MIKTSHKYGEARLVDKKVNDPKPQIQNSDNEGPRKSENRRPIFNIGRQQVNIIKYLILFSNLQEEYNAGIINDILLLLEQTLFLGPKVPYQSSV